MKLSMEEWIRTSGVDFVRIIYGLDAAQDESLIRELAGLVADGSNRKVTTYTLDDGLQLTYEKRSPPFKTAGELAYDLFKSAEIAAWWLINPAISTIYGFDGFVPGDRRSIALLSQLSDMVGPGTYDGHALSSELGVVEADLNRYGVVGVFYEPKEDDFAGFMKLADDSSAHHRYTALWALSRMSHRADLALQVHSALKTALDDKSVVVRECVERFLGLAVVGSQHRQTESREIGGASQHRQPPAEPILLNSLVSNSRTGRYFLPLLVTAIVLIVIAALILLTR